MVDPFELLKVLHALSAVDEARAVDIEKVTKIVMSTASELDAQLRVLQEMNYIVISNARVYLTELGVMKINSLFC